MTNYYIEQNNQIILFNDDRQKLENTIEFMPQYQDLSIVETQRPIIDFQFADTPEYIETKFIEAKTAKFAENDKIANETRHGQIFTLNIQNKECMFDTSETTQSDLKTAVLEILTGSETYNGWVCNNGVVINLTMQDVQQISATFKELSNVYPKWLYYYQLINSCVTAEEINAIDIDYNINVSGENSYQD